MSENVNLRLSEGIIFSDGVIREVGTNKVSIIGSFQIFNAAGFPFQSPPFNVTAMVDNLPRGQQLTVVASLQAADQRELERSMGLLRLDALLEPRAHIELTFAFPSVNFGGAGEYAVVIFVGEAEIGRKSLFVRSIPQLQTQAP